MPAAISGRRREVKKPTDMASLFGFLVRCTPELRPSWYPFMRHLLDSYICLVSPFTLLLISYHSNRAITITFGENTDLSLVGLGKLFLSG